MNNAELYQRINVVQKRDAKQCLEEYSEKIKWKKCGATVIDIGCGDGGVTNMLQTFIPDNCKALLGCDVNENMVQFANAHYAKDLVSFTMLDIGKKLPDRLREKFDHAFSFNALHWVKHQEIAFSNIYDLLTKGGGCLLMFLGHTPLYEVFREQARSPRWNCWMSNVEDIVSPYHECQDPERTIKTMMISIGFTNVEVKCLQKDWVYSSKQFFKDTMSALNPFRIPLEMQEDYLEDFVKAVHHLKLVDPSDNVDDSCKVKINYKVITVYGEK